MFYLGHQPINSNNIKFLVQGRSGKRQQQACRNCNYKSSMRKAGESIVQVLAEEAIVRIDGQFRVLRAVLVLGRGGYRVVYLDRDGREVHKEPLSRSQFKDTALTVETAQE